MKPILLLAFTVAAASIVMGDDDYYSDYDSDYVFEPLDCTAEDVFMCPSWGDACVPQDYVCDAELDCEDGSDEDELICGEGWVAEPLLGDYDLNDCTGDVYTCSSEYGDACIPQTCVCDGMIDCEDGSDEDDCGEDWVATPFEDWYGSYDSGAEAPIDVEVRAEARRKATAKAVKVARVKARAEAVAESPVE